MGGRDMEAGAVSVHLHHGGPQGAKPKAEVIEDVAVERELGVLIDVLEAGSGLAEATAASRRG